MRGSAVSCCLLHTYECPSSVSTRSAERRPPNGEERKKGLTFKSRAVFCNAQNRSRSRWKQRTCIHSGVPSSYCFIRTSSLLSSPSARVISFLRHFTPHLSRTQTRAHPTKRTVSYQGRKRTKQWTIATFRIRFAQGDPSSDLFPNN